MEKIQNIDLLHIFEPNQNCFIEVSAKTAEELSECKEIIILSIPKRSGDRTHFIHGKVSDLLNIAENWDQDNLGHINVRWNSVFKVVEQDHSLWIIRHENTYKDFMSLASGAR